jgi:hypothetical protein
VSAGKTAYARVPMDWAVNDTPREHFVIARKRTEGIVRGYLVRAVWENGLDLYALAESCYAQGIEDMVALETMRALSLERPAPAAGEAP